MSLRWETCSKAWWGTILKGGRAPCLWQSLLATAQYAGLKLSIHTLFDVIYGEKPNSIVDLVPLPLANKMYPTKS